MNRISVLAAAAVVLGVGIANAQQYTSMPLPKPPDGVQQLRYPTSAAQYEKVAQWYLQVIRQLPTRFHITQGDTDGIILLMKDCTGRIEADGIVTKTEATYCENVTMAKIHEVSAPYILQQAGGGN